MENKPTLNNNYYEEVCAQFMEVKARAVKDKLTGAKTGPLRFGKHYLFVSEAANSYFCPYKEVLKNTLTYEQIAELDYLYPEAEAKVREGVKDHYDREEKKSKEKFTRVTKEVLKPERLAKRYEVTLKELKGEKLTKDEREVKEEIEHVYTEAKRRRVQTWIETPLVGCYKTIWLSGRLDEVNLNYGQTINITDSKLARNLKRLPYNLAQANTYCWLLSNAYQQSGFSYQLEILHKKTNELLYQTVIKNYEGESNKILDWMVNFYLLEKEKPIKWQPGFNWDACNDCKYQPVCPGRNEYLNYHYKEAQENLRRLRPHLFQ